MSLKFLLAATALTAASLLPATATAQKAFPTAEAAGNALIEAIATNDDAAKREILGADYRRFIPPESIDAADRTAFLYASSKARKMIADGPEMAHLSVGADGWTLPVPPQRALPPQCGYHGLRTAITHIGAATPDIPA